MGLDVGSEGCALDQHVDSAPATLEGECLTIATDCLNSMCKRHCMTTRNAASLQPHIDDLFTTDTEDRTLARAAD